jgi:K+/H+ antiporter YhaU regulatory subunit KhtT
LVHLRRSGEVIQSSPQTILRTNDVLTFLGNVTLLEKLHRTLSAGLSGRGA